MRYKQGMSLYKFFERLSFSCFSHEFMVHINENVSFQQVAFLHLICYGNLPHNNPIKPALIFAIMIKDLNFFFNFIFIYFFFVNFKTIL